mmetsp:Transcript_37041/g.69242  ORF Transcript_37041/g.69242 Transcript_37041/m.69242 type:complete len:288 (-) Transcript_37041:16-879(-)
MILTPVVMSSLCDKEHWAFLFTLVAIFGVSCLNYIARELEMPFGKDPNDLPLVEFQDHMNNSMLMLIHEECDHVAHTSEKCPRDFKSIKENISCRRPKHFLDQNRPAGCKISLPPTAQTLPTRFTQQEGPPDTQVPALRPSEPAPRSTQASAASSRVTLTSKASSRFTQASVLRPSEPGPSEPTPHFAQEVTPRSTQRTSLPSSDGGITRTSLLSSEGGPSRPSEGGFSVRQSGAQKTASCQPEAPAERLSHSPAASHAQELSDSVLSPVRLRLSYASHDQHLSASL